MSVDTKRGNAPEFSVRQTWTGRFVLLVRSFETLASTGEWRDAAPRDLPTFFEYLIKGRPQ